jgi:Secretion system C-terminal sorting domain
MSSIFKLILLSFILLISTENSYSQVVNVPDSVLKKQLLTIADLNKNGQLEEAEALNCDSLNICCFSDFTGLDAFKNVRILIMWGIFTKLDSIELPSFPKIRKLSISYITTKVLKINSSNLLTEIVITGSPLNRVVLDSAPELVTLNLERNNLTEFSIDYAPKLIKLNLSESNLTIFKINYAPILSELNLSGNKLSSFQFNNLQTLKYLNLSNNIIRFLDLKHHLGLEFLSLSDNFIDTLNLSSHKFLKDLDCKQNDLRSIIFPDSSALINLTCRTNNLNHLDFSKIPNIEFLDISYNDFSSIDLTSLKNLTGLLCSGNSFQHLDLTKNKNITGLICSNNPMLEIIDLKNGGNTNIPTYMWEGKRIVCWSNPRLSCVNVDDSSSISKLTFRFRNNRGYSQTLLLIDSITKIDTICNKLKITLADSLNKTYCSGDTIKAKVDVSGNVIQGSEFLLLLSDENGSFNTPKVIGISKEVSPDSIIGIIPKNASYSSQYKLRVVNNTSSAISNDLKDSFTISPLPNPNIIGRDTVNQNDVGVVYTTKLNPGSTYSWSIIHGDAFISSSIDHVCVINFKSGSIVTLDVTETLNSACSRTDTLLIRVNPPSSIEELIGSQFKFYPNPVSGNKLLNISYYNPLETELLYEVTDVLGNLKMSDHLQIDDGITTIDLSGLVSGIYFIKVTISNSVYYHKVLIQ